MPSLIEKAKRLIRRYRLVFAIGSAIVSTLFLTVLSLVLYNVTGSAKLDLSRPGYDVARKQLKKSNESRNDFTSSGPFTEALIKEYLQRYHKQEQELSSYDDFNQKLLDDSQLGLTGDQVLPSDGANP